MSDMDYVYAVARIRSREVSLFSAAEIEQLLARPDYESSVGFLAEKGWGDAKRWGSDSQTGERKDLGIYPGTDVGHVRI